MASSVKNNAATVASGSKKRALIAEAEKNIFVWLSVSAVIISICLIAMQFLVRQMLFNNTVIGVKMDTNQQLEKNIKNAKILKSNLDKLITDEGLAAVGQQDPTANTKTSNLKVILDALPIDGDSTAFNNSLQNVVLPRSSVSITQLGSSREETGEPDMGAVDSSSAEPQQLPFSVAFSGNYDQVTKTFIDISRVIRPINITSLNIRSGDNRTLVVEASGTTYFMPEKTIKLKTVECKQGNKCP